MTEKDYQPGRIMSPEQYRTIIRERFKLTQEAAGVFFGSSIRTGQKWAADGPPPAVAMLLNLMDFSEMPPEEVESILRSMHGRKSRKHAKKV